MYFNHYKVLEFQTGLEFGDLFWITVTIDGTVKVDHCFFLAIICNTCRIDDSGFYLFPSQVSGLQRTLMLMSVKFSWTYTIKHSRIVQN